MCALVPFISYVAVSLQGAASGSAPFARHGAAVSPVTLSLDGSILAAGGSDGVRLRDGTHRAHPSMFGSPVSGSDAGEGWLVAFSLDGAVLAFSGRSGAGRALE